MIYVRDSIALRFDPLKRMYLVRKENQLVVRDLNKSSVPYPVLVLF